MGNSAIVGAAPAVPEHAGAEGPAPDRISREFLARLSIYGPAVRHPRAATSGRYGSERAPAQQCIGATRRISGLSTVRHQRPLGGRQPSLQAVGQHAGHPCPRRTCESGPDSDHAAWSSCHAGRHAYPPIWRQPVPASLAAVTRPNGQYERLYTAPGLTAPAPGATGRMPLTRAAGGGPDGWRLIPPGGSGLPTSSAVAPAPSGLDGSDPVPVPHPSRDAERRCLASGSR